MIEQSRDYTNKLDYSNKLARKQAEQLILIRKDIKVIRSWVVYFGILSIITLALSFLWRFFSAL